MFTPNSSLTASNVLGPPLPLIFHAISILQMYVAHLHDTQYKRIREPAIAMPDASGDEEMGKSDQRDRDERVLVRLLGPQPCKYNIMNRS